MKKTAVTIKKTKATKGSKKSNPPTVPTRVTRTTNQPYRFPHRELVMPIESGMSYSVEISPSNSSLFPWFSQVAALFDTYRVYNLRFEYVPSCSLMTTSGSLTMAIDYDCLDTPPSSRAALSQMGGAVSSQLYKACNLSADPAILRTNMRRFCHSTSSADPRLSTIGLLTIITDGDTSAPVGDLFVWYDVELSSPSPTVASAEQTFRCFDILSLVGAGTPFVPRTDSSGCFLAGTFPGTTIPASESKPSSISPGLLPSYEKSSIELKPLTLTYPEQGTYEVGAVEVSEPGLYTVTLTGPPCNSVSPSQLDIWSLSTGWDLISKVRRSVQVAQGVVQGTIEITFEVTRLLSTTMRLFHFYDAVFQYAIGAAASATMLWGAGQNFMFGFQGVRLGAPRTPLLLTAASASSTRSKAAKKLVPSVAASACVLSTGFGYSTPNAPPYQQSDFAADYNRRIEKLRKRSGDQSVRCVATFNQKLIEALRDNSFSASSAILSANRETKLLLRDHRLSETGAGYSEVLAAFQRRTSPFGNTTTTTTSAMGGKST